MTSRQRDLLASAKKLSPKRNSTEAENIQALAAEQLAHFSIDAGSNLGQSLLNCIERVYQCHGDVELMWQEAQASMHALEHDEQAALFNAKKFLSFQFAKVLDTLQNPFRRSYQSLGYSQSSLSAKSAYPVFDNVNACLLYTSPSPRDATLSRMPSSA